MSAAELAEAFAGLAAQAATAYVSARAATMGPEEAADAWVAVFQRITLHPAWAAEEEEEEEEGLPRCVLCGVLGVQLADVVGPGGEQAPPAWFCDEHRQPGGRAIVTSLDSLLGPFVPSLKVDSLQAGTVEGSESYAQASGRIVPRGPSRDKPCSLQQRQAGKPYAFPCQGCGSGPCGHPLHIGGPQPHGTWPGEVPVARAILDRWRSAKLVIHLKPEDGSKPYLEADIADTSFMVMLEGPPQEAVDFIASALDPQLYDYQCALCHAEVRATKGAKCPQCEVPMVER